MKKRLVYLMLPIITLILEVLPYGAVCNFANPEGKPWRKTFSYFDLTPFGYANFAPFITAIITCVVIALTLVYIFTGNKQIIAAAKILLCIGIAASLCPLLYGIRFFSVVGALITVSLIAELSLIYFMSKNKK